MSYQRHRRDFLKQTACALSLPVVSAGFATEPGANSSGEKLKIGVIGVGNRGASNLAEVLTEEIVALCDVDARYLNEMAMRHPAAKTYVDFRELLDHPDLDAVVVSSPDHTHFHAALGAMQRHLHVYCEKPLAHSLWELRQLRAAAIEYGVITQTGNQHHASAGYQRVIQIVQSGAIGAVTEVHAWTNRPIWPQGIQRPTTQVPPPAELAWDLWLGPAPERPYDSTYHPSGWRGWFDFGCGALGDMGPHLLDPVIWSLDLHAPQRISAESSGLSDESYPTSSVVRYEFSARGELPAVRLTWYDGDNQPPEAVTGLQRLPPQGVLLLGERAKLFVPPLGARPTVIPREPGQQIELPDPSPIPPQSHHQEWLAACKQRRPTRCDFAYGARLTEICLLGNVAMRAGQAIDWDHDTMRATNDVDLAHLTRRAYRDGW